MNCARKHTISILLAFILVLVTLPAFAADIQTSPAGELPIVAEGTDITLTVGVIQTPFIADYETNYFTKWLEDRTGVKLDFIQFPSDNAQEKVMLALSTNDSANLPDMFLSIGMTSNNTLFGPAFAPQWYDQGMIIPLNDLIDNYGVNINKALDKALEYGYNIRPWMTSADGNIYALPAFSASLTNSYPNKLWINQGWLDKLGLEMPTTTEEFRNVLLAFKNDDPNGNGEADEIPLAGAKNAGATLGTIGYDSLINAFIYNDTGNSRMYVEDGVVKFAPTTAEWREAMKYLHDLCKDGLFYSGSFTQDGTALQQIGTNENDILGAFEGLGFEAVVAANNLEVLARYNSMPALTGPEGLHFVTWAAPSIRPAGVITTKCQYPEIAFRVLDEMMTYDGSLITRYGEKGVNWDDADEGSISYYGTPAILKILENTWAQAGQNMNFLQQSPFILDPAIATGVQWGGNVMEGGYIKAIGVMKLDETGVVPDEFIANLVYTPDEMEAIQMPRNDIDTYILRSIANFVAGDWDPYNDKQWDTYAAEYERMGLSTYLETVQTVYTRMYGGK